MAPNKLWVVGDLSVKLEAKEAAFAAAIQERGVAGAVELMRAHSDCEVWQTAGCFALGSTERFMQEGGVEQPGDGEAILAILAAMSNFQGHPAVTGACLQALVILVTACKVNCARACAAGAVPLLVAAMSLLQDCYDARNCAIALTFLIAEIDVAAVPASGALVALVRALNLTATNEPVHYSVTLTAVCGMFLAHSYFSLPFIDAGGLSAIVTGCRAFSGCTEVQMNTCKLLFLMHQEVQLAQRHKDALLLSGAVAAVEAALLANLADEALVHVGCCALVTLRETINCGRQNMHCNTHVEVACMRAQPLSLNVQLYGCKALNAALHFGYTEDQDSAVAAGSFAVLQALWRAHCNSESVMVECCRALVYMIWENTPHVETAVAAGAIEATLKAMRAHPASLHLHNNSYVLLSMLLMRGEAPDPVVAKRMMAVGALQMAQRPDGPASASRADFIARMQEALSNAHRAADLVAAELMAEEDASAAASKKKRRSKKKAQQPDATPAEGAAAAAEEPAVTPTDTAAAAASAPTDAPAISTAPDATVPAPPAVSAAEAAVEPEPAVTVAAPSAAEAPAPADDGAMSNAQMLGQLFPWLLLDPEVSAANASGHVSPPLPQSCTLQQAVPETEHAAALAEEVVRLRAEVDASRCAICLDAAKCTVLLPCRHLVLCAAPACLAMLGAAPRCPMCREGVADTMQLFV